MHRICHAKATGGDVAEVDYQIVKNKNDTKVEMATFVLNGGSCTIIESRLIIIRARGANVEGNFTIIQ